MSCELLLRFHMTVWNLSRFFNVRKFLLMAILTTTTNIRKYKAMKNKKIFIFVVFLMTNVGEEWRRINSHFSRFSLLEHEMKSRKQNQILVLRITFELTSLNSLQNIPSQQKKKRRWNIFEWSLRNAKPSITNWSNNVFLKRNSWVKRNTHIFCLDLNVKTQWILNTYLSITFFFTTCLLLNYDHLTDLTKI